MANICEICVNYDFYPTEDSWMTKEGVFHHDKLKKKKKSKLLDPPLISVGWHAPTQLRFL
jgi:hypothetical protein